MAANKIVREQGKYLDVTPFHGKYCTINMTGQDVGYARVGIISSGRDFILFQFHGRRGLAAKAFIKDITEVRMTERMLKKEPELVVEEWDEDVILPWKKGSLVWAMSTGEAYCQKIAN